MPALKKKLNFPESAANYTHNGFDVLQITTESEKRIARNFMAESFFSRGIVPKNLKLAHTDFMHQEIDLAFESTDLSQLFFKGNQLVGCSLIQAFPTEKADPEFEDVEPVEWLNEAAKIAQEFKSDREAFDVFRDFQYQLLHKVFSREARRFDKDHVVYAGLVGIDVTKSGLVVAYCRQLALTKPADVFASWLSTVPGFRGKFEFKGSYEITYVPYKDLTFQRGSKFVFRDSPGGLVFEGAVLTRFCEVYPKH